MNPILYWNAVALEVERRDFTFNGEGNSSAAGKLNPEQGGPTRTSRALAIVHIAMYEAVVRSNPAAGLTSYTPLNHLSWLVQHPDVSAFIAGAVAGAAETALKMLWPRQTDFIAGRRTDSPGSASSAYFQDGAALGHDVAAALLIIRDPKSDGSDQPDDTTFSQRHGHHRPDPFAPTQGRLGTRWGSVTPFCINVPVNIDSYLAAPPAIGTERYNVAVKDVNQLGAAVGSARNADDTVVGIFWGYDGPRGLGVPPRLYNQFARAFVEQHDPQITVPSAARLFALINAGMADAAIVAWGAKYKYDLWRPVVGIREHDPGFGPNHGASIGVVTPTHCDPMWAPLGRPGTNTPSDLTKTPDFPAYPSGHAAFGAVSIRMLALFYAGSALGGTSDKIMDIAVDFVSDEFNGINQDPTGHVRPYHVRKITLRDAIVENAISRVLLGVHWRFDGIGAIAPEDLDGALPKRWQDPASVLGGPDEQRIGGVPAGLKIAKEVFGSCFGVHSVASSSQQKP